MTAADLEAQRQAFRNDPRFKTQFGRSQPATKRYPGAPPIDKKALGALAGIAGLIAAGQTATAALGEFGDASSPCGVWFRRSLTSTDPNIINDNNGNCALANCRERLKQLVRDGKMGTGITEIGIDAAMDALANYAREAAIGRLSVANQPAY